MRSPRICIIALCPLLLAGSQPSDQTWYMGPVQVTRRVSHSSPHVSDLVTVSYEIAAPEGYEIRFSQWGDTPSDVQISGATEPEPVAGESGRQLWRQQFAVEALLAGEYRLPALEVAHRKSPEAAWTVEGTDYLTLAFSSVLENADSAEPKPNPDPLPWPRGLWPWIISVASLLAVVGLVGAGTFALMRRGRRPSVPISVSAYRKAMDAIQRIEAAGWLERGDVDRFYTELSGVVRRYIEDRFGLRAPELTTEEFLQELTRRPVLVDAQRLALSHFLKQCDLVKFAKVRPTTHEGGTALHAARAFVEVTRDDSMAVIET
jgi:hypothetical protein